MCFITGVVSVVFYFILKYFHTANLIPSTISVTTSFLAVYLTFKRSPYFALAYAANDIVLIILWGLASFTSTRYISVVVCFVAFLINDIYSYTNWKKMKARQSQTTLWLYLLSLVKNRQSFYKDCRFYIPFIMFFMILALYPFLFLPGKLILC